MEIETGIEGPHSREKKKTPTEVDAPAGVRSSRIATRFARGPIYYMWPTSDIFTIASVVKNALSTAPMLMYQHSRSAVSMPGR
jgi:hypothetical protein